LIEGAYYIKIAGQVFKKEEKRWKRHILSL
jgi:hypothetical protein